MEQHECRYRLGANVRNLRKEQKLSQAKLALMVGRDRSFISRIERGLCNATLDTIIALSLGLGISPSQLLDGIVDTLEREDASTLSEASPRRL